MNSKLFKIKTITLIIVIILSMTLFPVYTIYADELPKKEDCTACARTSPYVEKYIQFSNDIIYTLQRFANKESSIFTTGGNPTLTSSNNNNTGGELKRQLQAITDNMNNLRQMTASTTYVTAVTMGEMGINARVSIGILTSSNALYRDRNKLEDIGQKTMNTITDLGNAGVFVRIGFKEGRKESIQNILRKYSTGDNPLFIYNQNNSFTVQPLEILGNNGIRTMTQTVKLGLYNNYFKKAESVSKSYMGGSISFSPGFIEEYNRYYECAKGLVGVSLCSSVHDVAKAQFSSIAADAKKDTDTAMKTFKNAWERLAGFWAKNAETKESKALASRKYELLRGEYGRKAAKASFLKGLADSRANAKQSIKDNINYVNSAFEGVDYTPPAKKTPVRIGDQEIQSQIKQEKETLLMIGTETAREANTSRQESVYTDITPITMLFPVLTKNIIAEKMLLDGKGDKNSIYALLGVACENQCTNIPGKKCTYP